MILNMRKTWWLWITGYVVLRRSLDVAPTVMLNMLFFLCILLPCIVFLFDVFVSFTGFFQKQFCGCFYKPYFCTYKVLSWISSCMHGLSTFLRCSSDYLRGVLPSPSGPRLPSDRDDLIPRVILRPSRRNDISISVPEDDLYGANVPDFILSACCCRLVSWTFYHFFFFSIPSKPILYPPSLLNMSVINRIKVFVMPASQCSVCYCCKHIISCCAKVASYLLHWYPLHIPQLAALRFNLRTIVCDF